MRILGLILLLGVVGCSPNYLELGEGGSGCAVIRGSGPVNIGAPGGDVAICRTTFENSSLTVRTADTIVVIQHGDGIPQVQQGATR